MYYRSKSEFYLRQYVLPIGSVVFTLSVIFVGLYVYWASHSDNANKQKLVVASNEPEKEIVTEDNSQENVEINNDNKTENLALEEVTKQEETIKDTLKDLPNLQLSDNGKVTNVDDKGILTFKYKDIDYIILMISINTSNVSKDFIDTLKKDLLNKDIKVAFDNQKTDGTNKLAYVYLNDKLYNEYLLEKGLAEYKEDSLNSTYKSNLIQAQAYAKQVKNGIWSK